MRARSAKQASLDCRSARTSSASIAVDGCCPPHSCRNAELDHVSCDRILHRWETFAKDDAEFMARGLATEQQVSGTQARAAGCAARRVITFDASSPVAG
jgi:hypothetical protein